MISGVLAVVVWFVTLIVGGCFGIWVGWGLGADHEAEEQYRLDRHTHRKGDPAPGVLIQLPLSGRLAVEPDPHDWRFAGGWDQGPVAAPAEVALLTQTAEQPVSVTGEPPIDTGEIQAITEWADALIADMVAQGNYDRHTMRAD